jgi:hypothetical protein
MGEKIKTSRYSVPSTQEELREVSHIVNKYRVNSIGNPICWSVWRVVKAKMGSLHEVNYRWTYEELIEANDVLDLDDEIRSFYTKKHEAEMRIKKR